MDYLSKFRELQIQSNPIYPHNDIGVARLFYELHSDVIRYVIEPKTWYFFNGRLWIKDEGGFIVMERCKEFTQGYDGYIKSVCTGEAEGDKPLLKFAAGLTGRKRREGILSDARSIQPVSLAEFDHSRFLVNCLNGTYSLTDMMLRFY